MQERALKYGNLIVGWGVFIIALITFGLTVEPTASYWDCGEYIATSVKLQVGHPPGAPLYQMLGAFFAMFAQEAESIAISVNMMSVLASAFAVMFLFWNITHMLKRFVFKASHPNNSQLVLIWGAGLVGALSLTFSDSFWFNAVEAEVYAMATFILSLMFYLGLRWEQDLNTPRGDRWLVLIAFVVGLSFGVHFMGLLTIPAIGMLFFFKKYQKVNFKSFLIANVVSVAILLFIFKLLLPTTLAFFGKSEVFFVNTIGLPFNSGSIIAALIVISFFVWSLQYTRKIGWVNVQTGILCVLFILIGFSSWLMLPIRANANTVINENDPSDARSLLAYYNLEQYPETHLFYGPLFSDQYAGQDPEEPYVDGKPKFERDYKTQKYVVVNDWELSKINSNSQHVGLLPRMWSSEHAANYQRYYGFLDFSVKPAYRSEQQLVGRVQQFKQEVANGNVDADDYHNFLKQFGSYLNVEKPSFWSNLQYMLEYQMGYMYWRYFMWNFSGRQNDLKGEFSPLEGNWISGFDWLDSLRLGSQHQLPAEALQNKARNTYYMLPFLLGLVGLLFMFNKDQKRFWVLLLFFLFTGLALKVYLNERPFEPRERDYALVGSFYVYAMFIGLGVVGLFESLKKILNKRWLAPLVTVSCLLAVPTLMAFENWDDHDRSNRYTAQSTAKAYLDSVDENVGAIIFTIGDNDTFALWYAQEVEGYRTDVRSINTSLLHTDWYIDQTKRQTYESAPVTSKLNHNQYVYGTRDYIKYEPLLDSVRWDIKDFINWVASDNPRTRYKHLLKQYDVDLSNVPLGTQNLVYYPTNKIRVPVNKENVLKSGLVQPKDAGLIVDYIDIDLPTSGIYKAQIMMLDFLAQNDWKRPIYFTGGSFSDNEYIWMKEYLQLEGLVYKLVPIRTPSNPANPYEMGRIDSEKMYDIVMRWKWGNAKSPDIYHDPETRKNSISFRSNLMRLAEKLIEEEKFEKAEKVLDLGMENMPINFFGYYSLLDPFIHGYYKVEKAEKAEQYFKTLETIYLDRLRYYGTLSLEDQYKLGETIITDVERYRSLVELVISFGKSPLPKEAAQHFLAATTPLKTLYGDYDFYTVLVPFLEVFYKNDIPDIAQPLFDSIANALDDRLSLFAGIPPEQQSAYLKSIMTEISSYKTLYGLAEEFETEKRLEKIRPQYEKSLSAFDALFNAADLDNIR